ncbi:MAG: pyruvate ferredoxin oxidoreductase [Candidatus Moranbacteria bacterium]|nr:pyruvate ferredoxin oxidoreductase [Candidatus Moranbacteria bacterium]
MALTGAEAAAEAMRQIEPGVVPVYPITPQTPIIEKFAKFAAGGRVKSEVITAESEHSVMSAAIGAAAAGVRSMTATSSQGLAYMFEMLYVASGLRLPIVMNVASRALSAPINIHCDHSDVMGVRDSGWIQLFCETAQEVYDHTILAVKLAENEKVYLPAMVAQDGFFTSHTLEGIETLTDEQVKDFVGKYRYPISLLREKDPITLGSLVLPDRYFEIKMEQEKAMRSALEVFLQTAQQLSELTQRKYSPVETFQVDAETEAVIIVMGSAAGTTKAVAKRFSQKSGQKVGVIKICLFRPFPYDELGDIIKDIKNVAVLDRSFSFGSTPPLYQETVQTIHQFGRAPEQQIQSCVYGLGGRDLREEDVKNVYENILAGNYTEEPGLLNCETKPIQGG